MEQSTSQSANHIIMGNSTRRSCSPEPLHSVKAGEESAAVDIDESQHLSENVPMELLRNTQSSAGQHNPAYAVSMGCQESNSQVEEIDGNLPEAGLDPDATGDNESDQLQAKFWDGQNKYDLRRQVRESKPAFSSTWLDDDKTGYYDPSEERRKLRQRPKRPTNLLKPGFRPWDFNESEGESEERKERQPKPVPRLEVTLTLSSEAGKAAFREHVQKSPEKEDPSEEFFGERRLRRRDSGVGLSRTLAPKSGRKCRLPEDFPDDFTGHPFARGCWECLTLGIRCPLLDDPRAWPCTTCLDDDNACDLIITPTYKRPCEHCKSRRTGCSYTYSLDHDHPCEECTRTGWRCVAGPAKESIRERLSYDRDWQNDPWQAPKPPKVKKLPSCRRCRGRTQPCSFASGDQSDVCTSCDMADEACLPELETSRRSRKRKRAKTKQQTGNDAAEKDEDEVDDRNQIGSRREDIMRARASKPTTTTTSDGSTSSSNDVAQPPPTKWRTNQKPILISEGSEDSSSDADSDILPPRKKAEFPPSQKSDKGVLKTITTKFAHPIAFNYEGNKKCHFCTDIRFAMFGLGPAEVEAVVWNDGRGLEEISGGHRGRGIENTRMCVSCTTQRLPAMMCGRHEVQPVEGVTVPFTNEKTRALTTLLSGKTTGHEQWCSLCPTLAQYSCCTPGPYGKGCGLLLCEACMVSVVSNDGSLERALKELKDEPTPERVLGLRADAGFLRKEGLLARWVVWESSKSEV